MTDATPETTDPAAHAEERLGGSIAFDTSYSPEQFLGPKAGHGRWFTLSMNGKPLGDIWTNDTDGLGYIPRSEVGRLQTPDWVMSFSAAKGMGQTATEVFDTLAGAAGLGLQAGPVTEGNLDTLEF